MLSPNEAHAAILARVPVPAAREAVPLSEACGRHLAEEVVSDVDMPPFEKSMMDGYAVRSADFADSEGGVELACVGESRAGVPFPGRIPSGSCIEIFTGAEVPSDCDAVEMIERTRREGERVRFERRVRPGQHVSSTGEILGRGRTVYEPHRLLGAADLSVLASVGCDPVPVFVRPRVSVLTTGDELVPPTVVPGPGQIREGNTFYLSAACRALGCEVRRSGAVPDEQSALERAFDDALETGDCLITSGGVSVGKYDLVGAALERIGVEPVLHKVAIKPGKPIWFGVRGAKPVFGLPGNPVSSLLGFEVFVRPALVRMGGGGPEEQAERLPRARWNGPVRKAGDRQGHVPARLVPDGATDGARVLEPLAFLGSSDIVSAARADALAVIPAHGEIGPDEIVSYRPIG